MNKQFELVQESLMLESEEDHVGDSIDRVWAATIGYGSALAVGSAAGFYAVKDSVIDNINKHKEVAQQELERLQKIKIGNDMKLAHNIGNQRDSAILKAGSAITGDVVKGIAVVGVGALIGMMAVWAIRRYIKHKVNDNTTSEEKKKIKKDAINYAISKVKKAKQDASKTNDKTKEKIIKSADKVLSKLNNKLK